LVKTLNKLISKAKGEYITICASDDFWPPTRLEEQVAALGENPDAALVHGIPAIVDEAGNIAKDKRYGLEQMLDGETAFEDLLWRRKKFQTTTIMIRASVYEELGGYDENIAVEDVDWMLRVTRSYPVKAIARVWTYYRKHGENWTMTPAGAHKLIRAERQVARKLGGRAGCIFAFARVPSWLLLERRAQSGRRFLYLLLLPFYFWSKLFVFNFFAVVFGESLARSLLRVKKS
jgi:glycosyltransferase involved in cell wall biosynthesis